MGEHTFLFADLAGFTALTEAHGDMDAASVAARFAAMAEQVLTGDARLVKTMGDAVMVVSDDPESAVMTALDLAALVDAEPLFPALRAGLNQGTAVEQNQDFFGAAVNVAARIAAHARSGQILCTEPTAAAAENLEIVSIRPAGQAHFKNVSRPVELFEIEDQRRRETSTEVDPVCHMRIDPEFAPARLPFGDRSYHFCSFECARAFAERPEAYAGR